ncbi:MAG: PHP domain-containing protein, partial [Sphingomonadales bacterium]|nr:PHP domain-containing protein [Sphingomonadales bacterium]
MSHASFVHLAVHTAYSLSEGAIHISALSKWCVDHQVPAVAMTDTNNLFGALEFTETLRKAGVQPIIACSMAITNPHAEISRGGHRP